MVSSKTIEQHRAQAFGVYIRDKWLFQLFGAEGLCAMVLNNFRRDDENMMPF